MRDPYFQFLLLITSLPPSLLCKCCINFLARKRVTLLCFGFHASILRCRQKSLQHSSNVDKLGNFEDPVSLGPRECPLEMCWMRDGESKCRDGYSDSIHGAG